MSHSSSLLILPSSRSYLLSRIAFEQEASLLWLDRKTLFELELHALPDTTWLLLREAWHCERSREWHGKVGMREEERRKVGLEWGEFGKALDMVEVLERGERELAEKEILKEKERGEMKKNDRVDGGLTSDVNQMEKSGDVEMEDSEKGALPDGNSRLMQSGKEVTGMEEEGKAERAQEPSQGRVGAFLSAEIEKVLAEPEKKQEQGTPSATDRSRNLRLKRPAWFDEKEQDLEIDQLQSSGPDLSQVPEIKPSTKKERRKSANPAPTPKKRTSPRHNTVEPIAATSRKRVASPELEAPPLPSDWTTSRRASTSAPSPPPSPESEKKKSKRKLEESAIKYSPTKGPAPKAKRTPKGRWVDKGKGKAAVILDFF